MVAFRSGNSPSFSVPVSLHHRGSTGFPNRLSFNILSHCTQLWKVRSIIRHECMSRCVSPRICHFTSLHRLHQTFIQQIAFIGDDMMTPRSQSFPLLSTQRCPMVSIPLISRIYASTTVWLQPVSPPDKFNSFSPIGFPHWPLFDVDDIDYRVRPSVRRC
jgi:hypothetical protein